jgi:hypothetical protein
MAVFPEYSHDKLYRIPNSSSIDGNSSDPGQSRTGVVQIWRLYAGKE